MVSSDLGSSGMVFRDVVEPVSHGWYLQKTLDQRLRANYLGSVKTYVSCYCTNTATTNSYFRYSYWVMSGKPWLPWRSLPVSSGRTHKMYFTKFFYSFVNSQSISMCLSKTQGHKQKKHQISAYFNYSLSIARISTWSKRENNCVQIPLCRCDRRLLYIQRVLFVCLLLLGTVQITSRYDTKIIHLSRLSSHQM